MSQYQLLPKTHSWKICQNILRGRIIIKKKKIHTHTRLKNKVKQYYFFHIAKEQVVTQEEVCINSVSAVYDECDSSSWVVCMRCKFGAIQGRKNESFGTCRANTNGYGKRASKKQTTQNSGWSDLGQGMVGQNTSNDPAQGKHRTLQKFYLSIPKHKQKTILQSLHYWRHSSIHSPRLPTFISPYTYPCLLGVWLRVIPSHKDNSISCHVQKSVKNYL